MENIKMKKTDDEQYCGHLSAGRYYLAAVRNRGEKYGIITGVIDISDYLVEYEEIVSNYYGSVDEFEKHYPKYSDREQLFAEMCFECTPPSELSWEKTYQKYREAMDALTDKFQTRRLFIDMDGTLTHFTPATMEQLNTKGYFRNRVPQANIVAAIRKMMKEIMNVEYFILSGVLDNPYAREEKIEWLKENLPEFDEDHIIFVPCGQDKSGFVPGGVSRYDFLLDDFSLNLHEWPATAIKLKNDLNGTKGTWNGKPTVRYDQTPEKIKQQLLQYLFDKEPQVDSSEETSAKGKQTVLKLNLGNRVVTGRMQQADDGLSYIGVSIQCEKEREMEFCRIKAYPDVNVVELLIKPEDSGQEERYLIKATTSGFDLQYQE